MLTHLYRPVVRQWRLYGAVFVVLTLAVGLLAALPLVAGQLAAVGLRQTVGELTVSGRNVLLQGRVIEPNMQGALKVELGDLYAGVMQVRRAQVPALNVVGKPAGLEPIDREILDWLLLDLHTFSELTVQVEIVTGRLPAPQTNLEINDEEPTVLEAAIGVGAAEKLGIDVGDVLFSGDTAWAFEIVGLVEPADPASDRWWGDEHLLPFNTWERLDLDLDVLEVTSGLIMNEETLPVYFPTSLSWRLLLDQSQITVANSEAVADSLRGLEADLTSQSIDLETQLTATLDQFAAERAAAQLALLLLLTQSLLVVLYTLAVLSEVVLAQAANEIVMLAARGVGTGRLVVQFALRYGVVAVVGWLVGLLVAATWLWHWPMAGVVDVAWEIPAGSWLLGGGAAVVGWLVLLWPVATMARRGPLAWQQARTRPDGRPTERRRLALDGAMLALGGLAYWQLRQFSATALANDEAVVIDPLLLLGPTLLLLGVALLLRHIAPLVIMGLAWGTGRLRGALLPTALRWLGRDRQRSGRLILLVSVATGLILFATIFVQSLAARQAEVALFRSGADMRWSVAGQQADIVAETMANADEVSAVARVFRGRGTAGGNTVRVDFLAVDVAAIAGMSGYPAGWPDGALDARLALLTEPINNVVPALVSARNALGVTETGEEATVRLGSLAVRIEVVGILETFPTVRPSFVVVDLGQVEAYLAARTAGDLPSAGHEVWVDIEQPIAALDLREQVNLPANIRTPRLLSEAVRLEQGYNDQLLARQIVGVFRLNVVVLIGLGVATLLALQLLDVRRRTPALGALASLGVSRRGVMGLLFWEGAVLVLVGVGLGIGLGLLLTQMTQPLLAVVLQASVGGGLTMALPFSLAWGRLGVLLAGVVGLYWLAMLIPVWETGRWQIAEKLRLGVGE